MGVQGISRWEAGCSPAATWSDKGRETMPGRWRESVFHPMMNACASCLWRMNYSPRALTLVTFYRGCILLPTSNYVITLAFTWTQ